MGSTGKTNGLPVPPRRHRPLNPAAVREHLLLTTALLPATCRLRQWWYLAPGIPPAMPTAVALVREGSKWVLIDAGTRNNGRQLHASMLVQALKETIPEGDTLVAIACERQQLRGARHVVAPGG